MESLLHEHPFTVRFRGEKGVDFGGVCRDMFSAFFEDMYQRVFDGNALLAPVVHPGVDFSVLAKIGTAISHAYLACGVLPIRIAFPALVRCLLGTSTVISESILREAFIDNLCSYEADALKEAYAQLREDPQRKGFSNEVSDKLINVFSRYGSRQCATPNNLKQMIIQVASYEFLL